MSITRFCLVSCLGEGIFSKKKSQKAPITIMTIKRSC